MKTSFWGSEIASKNWTDPRTRSHLRLRVVAAGNRTVTVTAPVAGTVAASGFPVSGVISGRAKGVGRLGEAWAKGNGVTVEVYPADGKWCGTGPFPVPHPGHVRPPYRPRSGNASVGS